MPLNKDFKNKMEWQEADQLAMYVTEELCWTTEEKIQLREQSRALKQWCDVTT